jgi:hypothetical protein
MKCEVCRKELLMDSNHIVCSDDCRKIRTEIYRIIDKYKPCNGCENCRGDLHLVCSDKCRSEFKESGEFGKELWGIVSLIYPMEEI